MMFVYISLALLFSVHCGVTKHVEEKQCKDVNAEFSECPIPRVCRGTCDNLDYVYITCPPVCEKPGCQCKPGFVLNENEKCIDPWNCPERKCEDENAVYKACTSACERTCDNWDHEIPCNDVCMPGRCVCKDGFVFNKKDEKCVKPENCPAQ